MTHTPINARKMESQRQDQNQRVLRSLHLGALEKAELRVLEAQQDRQG